MKTVYKIALLLAGALLFGCNPTPAEPENPDTPVKPEPEPAVSLSLSFVLPADDLCLSKKQWVDGDEIVVHGEYAKEQVVVKLSAGDIDATGKIATLTVDGLHPYKSADRECTLYASYPASATANPNHCFCYTGFKDDNVPMLAAYNVDNTFNFVNISSAIKFVVNGSFDSYTLTSRKGATFGYEYYQVKLTDEETNMKQYVSNPRTGFSSSVITPDGKTENWIFIAGEISLPSGYSFRFLKNGETAKTYSTKVAGKAAVGKVLDLGNLTEFLKDPVDTDHATPLDSLASANSYVITKPGTYKFAGVMGNDKTLVIDGVTSMQLLWETWNTLEEVTPNSIVKSVEYDSDSEQVLLKTPATLHPGNALIAAKDADGKILWSWHIWVPATEIVTDSFGGVYGDGDLEGMDRNLGALVAATEVTTGVVDSLSFGLFYQWGRKDPFPGMGCWGNTPMVMAGVQMTRQESPVTTEESLAIPTVYTYTPSGNEGMNWNKDEIFLAWGEDGVKSIYDPCPPGYRVPINGGAWVGSDKWVYKMNNGYFKIGTAVFPYAGYMDDNGGQYCHNGDRSVIWNAKHGSLQNGKCTFIDGAAFRSDNATRTARGSSVRCVCE
ncbi:MAG: hypothetical protein IKS71_01510 [Bacteroidales bacterium]|nr:hypothetical protein [Bacteroidales bacterium]